MSTVSRSCLQSLGDLRPDVVRALKSIDPGTHQVTFVDFSPAGAAFNLSSLGLKPANLPFSQGDHAGRRLLLAEPVSHPGQVTAVEGQDGWDFTFTAPQTYLLLDLGRTVHGRLSAEVSGPVGAVLDIGWDERLHPPSEQAAPLSRLASSGVEPGRFMGARWDEEVLTTLDARAGRYVLIAAWGDGPLKIENLRVL